MIDELKRDFDGILELVNKCPQGLQELALKTILEHWFATRNESIDDEHLDRGTGRPSQGAIGATGVPDVVKPFMTAQGITSDVLGKAFHPAGPGAQLLASGIEGGGKAAKQINLAILLCVRQALDTGSFTCTLKELREMAVHYDCYDSTNFSANLK